MIRVAEIVAAAALGTDLGLGRPLMRSLQCCLLSVRLGRHLGLDSRQIHDLYYVSLTALLGCTVDSGQLASIFGDDLAFGHDVGPVFMGGNRAFLGWMLREYRRDAPVLRRTKDVARAFVTLPRLVADAGTAHCEVARRLASRLGLEHLSPTLDAVYERFDGSGAPRHLAGQALPIEVRILQATWDISTFHAIGGPDLALGMLKRRTGTAFDPNVATCFEKHRDEVLEVLAHPSPWTAVLEEEPRPHRTMAVEQIDVALTLFADFVDLKSPYTTGHSRRVAELARDAASVAGLGAAAAEQVYRAGLLHDLGKVAVSNGIWDKPGSLSDADWEAVRLHTWHGERILGRIEILRPVCELAFLDHERMDGSGYHRGAKAPPKAARILAAADVFVALTETRPHRPARSTTEAVVELQREAEVGRLEGDSVRAVILAAGERPKRALGGARGLTARELEVLVAFVRGLTMKEIAARLRISPKTVDHHLQHIYDKLGVRTRAGARVFAMEKGLVEDS